MLEASAAEGCISDSRGARSGTHIHTDVFWHSHLPYSFPWTHLLWPVTRRPVRWALGTHAINGAHRPQRWRVLMCVAGAWQAAAGLVHVRYTIVCDCCAYSIIVCV